MDCSKAQPRCQRVAAKRATSLANIERRLKTKSKPLVAPAKMFVDVQCRSLELLNTPYHSIFVCPAANPVRCASSYVPMPRTVNRWVNSLWMWMEA